MFICTYIIVYTYMYTHIYIYIYIYIYIHISYIHLFNLFTVFCRAVVKGQSEGEHSLSRTSACWQSRSLQGGLRGGLGGRAPAEDDLAIEAGKVNRRLRHNRGIANWNVGGSKPGCLFRCIQCCVPQAMR